MVETKLIIIEGIMGSGKTTTGRYLANQLTRQQLEGEFIREDFYPHPVLLITDLPHPFAPWLDLGIDTYIEQSLTKWRRFVASAATSTSITILDGRLFHGDMTNLLMMAAPSYQICQYVLEFGESIRPLHPLLIYFYQAEVEKAMRKVFAARGSKWEAYQVNWKCASPYCRQQGWNDLDGLIEFYKVYRGLTDQIFEQLTIRKLTIENSAADWDSYYRQIFEFIGLLGKLDG